LSNDTETMPEALAALAASTALVLSDIPWQGPISEVRVAKVNGEYVVNPSRTQLKEASLEFIVAATEKDLLMVEGEAKECDESELIEAIQVAHETIKQHCKAQLSLAEKIGVKMDGKRPVSVPEIDEELNGLVHLGSDEKIYALARNPTAKKSRKDQFDEIKAGLKEFIIGSKSDEYYAENSKKIAELYEKNVKHIVREVVMAEGKRLDGRKTDEVRPIWTEIDVLPAAHGSSLFNRGETQALGVVTLGSKKDEMLVDTAFNAHDEGFIFHYNFPPFSVGEVKPQRGPGRREIGHANLAARSVKQIMPPDNAYTIRIVADILESNGSTSMASVCVASMALMDAGIKIKAPIAGVAMGLIKDQNREAILTDILGDEDALGDMDFKITGTSQGICGCQMDMKIDGLQYGLLEKALAQAKAGRLHILAEMAKSIDVAREDYKPHAPRIVEIRIPKSLIGAVIGPGGKIIQDIQATTGTVVNIEEEGDEGIVSIASSNKEAIEKALARVKAIIFVPEIGETYEAKVSEILPFGVVVDFQGKQGLLHVSEISYTRIENVEEVFTVGDELKVKLLDIDPRSGKYKLSRKALMPRPAGAGPENGGDSSGRDRSYSDRGRGGRSGGGSDRGGFRRDDRRDGGDRRDSGRGGSDRRDGGGDRRDNNSGGGDRRDNRGGDRRDRPEYGDRRPSNRNEGPNRPAPVDENQSVQPPVPPVEQPGADRPNFDQPRPEGLNWED
jgi:polyribonucleotide nucleotidyltransferase